MNRAPVLVLALLLGCGGVETPARPTPPAVRLDPSGALAVAPSRFTFPAVPGAASYLVVVWDGQRREVARVKGTASPLILPDALGGYFMRGEPYSWTLEAFDASGVSLGAGRPVPFQLR